MQHAAPTAAPSPAHGHHGWSQSSKQRHPCCIEPWCTFSGKSPYIVTWEETWSVLRRVVSHSSNHQFRVCMLFQKASLQAHRPGESALAVYAGPQLFHHLG